MFNKINGQITVEKNTHTFIEPPSSLLSCCSCRHLRLSNEEFRPSRMHIDLPLQYPNQTPLLTTILKNKLHKVRQVCHSRQPMHAYYFAVMGTFSAKVVPAEALPVGGLSPF